MAIHAFAIPVVPGAEQLDIDTLGEMDGARREEYVAAMKDAGLTRHAIFHQETPNGTMAIVLVESDDPTTALNRFGGSDAPFNSWFRDQMREVHGVDLSEPAPPVKKIHDTQL